MINNPFLSICITSYNRVDELFRCLMSIDIECVDVVEIIVSEDCSPRKVEIEKIVHVFISQSRYSVIYNSNLENLGFDQNFAKLQVLAKGNFLLYITDDDTFRKGELDRTINVLRSLDCAVAFTPYFDKVDGNFARKYTSSMQITSGIKSVEYFLYSSILLSGLIFKKSNIINYSPSKFKNLIYSQVYLFSSILYRNGGAYIDIPLIDYIGDGENSFGKNESGDKDILLSNRKSVYSNIEYHKRLIKVIDFFDDENGTDLKKFFSKEYSIKSYTGMYIARKVGLNELTLYRKKIKMLNIKLSTIVDIYYWLLRIFGCKVCDYLLIIPKKMLFSYRSFKIILKYK
jgi:glycosyltransferase involved in cell wall biosynthesis